MYSFFTNSIALFGRNHADVNGRQLDRSMPNFVQNNKNVVIVERNLVNPRALGSVYFESSPLSDKYREHRVSTVFMRMPSVTQSGVDYVFTNSLELEGTNGPSVHEVPRPKDFDASLVVINKSGGDVTSQVKRGCFNLHQRGFRLRDDQSMSRCELERKCDVVFVCDTFGMAKILSQFPGYFYKSESLAAMYTYKVGKYGLNFNFSSDAIRDEMVRAIVDDLDKCGDGKVMLVGGSHSDIADALTFQGYSVGYLKYRSDGPVVSGRRDIAGGLLSKMRDTPVFPTDYTSQDQYAPKSKILALDCLSDAFDGQIPGIYDRMIAKMSVIDQEFCLYSGNLEMFFAKMFRLSSEGRAITDLFTDVHREVYSYPVAGHIIAAVIDMSLINFCAACKLARSDYHGKNTFDPFSGSMYGLEGVHLHTKTEYELALRYCESGDVSTLGNAGRFKVDYLNVGLNLYNKITKSRSAFASHYVLARRDFEKVITTDGPANPNGFSVSYVAIGRDMVPVVRDIDAPVDKKPRLSHEHQSSTVELRQVHDQYDQRLYRTSSCSLNAPKGPVIQLSPIMPHSVTEFMTAHPARNSFPDNIGRLIPLLPGVQIIGPPGAGKTTICNKHSDFQDIDEIDEVRAVFVERGRQNGANGAYDSALDSDIMRAAYDHCKSAKTSVIFGAVRLQIMTHAAVFLPTLSVHLEHMVARSEQSVKNYVETDKNKLCDMGDQYIEFALKNDLQILNDEDDVLDFIRSTLSKL